MIRAIALLAIVAAFTPPAHAQAVCAGIAETAVLLAEGGWTAHSGGTADGATVTVYTHPDGRWLALYVTRTQACIVSMGTGWADLGPNA
jgi:hypothetical protein